MAQETGLKLSASLDKKIYMLDEPIFIDIIIQNISDKTIKALPLMLGASWHNFHITLRKENGKELPYTGLSQLMAYSKEEAMIEISPNENMLEVQNLLQAFGKLDNDAHSIIGFIPQEKYIAQIYYRAGQIVLTDSLRFEIIDPVDKEMQAHKLLIKLLRRDGKSKDLTESIKIWEEFGPVFPNSNYKKIVQGILLYRYLRVGQFEKRNELINKILTESPNSGLTYTIFDYHHKYGNYKRTQTLVKGSRAEYYHQCLGEMEQLWKRWSQNRKKQGR